MMLENLRFEPGETKGDEDLGAALAGLADCYVNDAFGAAHRAHASVVGPPRHIPSAAGRLLAAEIDALGGLLESPARPFVALLGGSKVSDKIGVIDALLDRCDLLLVGGAMASTFLAAQGHPVGDSLVELDQVDQCRSRLDTGKVSVPTDAVIAKEIAADALTAVVAAVDVPDGLEDPRHRPGDRHRSTPPRWPGPGRCSGTAPWASSRSSPSPPAPGPWPRRWRRPTATPSSAAATAPPPWPSSASPSRSATSPPAEGRRSSSWSRAICRACGL